GTGSGLFKTLDLDSGKSWFSYKSSPGMAKGGVSAIAVKGDLIWVATAIDTIVPEGLLPAGGGLSYSKDAGATWSYIHQPGVTPVQNVTYDIAIVFDTTDTEIDTVVWTTSWGGGLKKSSDMGQTWEVVTPDTFLFDPFERLNHRAFSVISVGKTLWVGTAGGINKSTDGGKTWTNFNHQNQEEPISGNFVVAIGHQNYNGKDLIWAATINAEDTSEFKAVSITEDGGFTWRTTLHQEWSHNFAFDGSVAYVATDNGLFKSIDGGYTWAAFPPIYDFTKQDGIYTTEFYSVGVSPGHVVWAGSADGLARTEDNGITWKIIRSYVPTGVEKAPRTYACPNPFSPRWDQTNGGQGLIRIIFNTTRPTKVDIKIFDFAMDLVRTLEVKDRVISAAREQCIETWDCKNDRGDFVANGVYFYRLELEGEGTYWGKIIILD
ncbi:MAG: hypothetical protein ONB05_06270, partial [candidate division KSB1 bacterium]|nr:hypothetical protein [candidate division KSB1 bacterium]